MKLTLTMLLVVAAVSAAFVPATGDAQFYGYPSRVRNRVVLGGPLGPAPLDPYSVSAYFGWLPSPIVARQTVGHQIISTGPNGYVYRPVYADELDQPPQAAAMPATSTSFVSRHAAMAADSPPPADLPVPWRPAVAPPGKQGDEAFAAALADMRIGEYQLALDALQAILDRDAKRGDAELLAAQALFALADYPRAVAALGRAVELSPPHEWDRYVADYRRYFPSSLQYIVRLRRLERYVDDQPDDPSGPLLLGYHYGALGFADEALGLFDQAQGEPLARRLRGHFAGRRAGHDDDAPVPEDVAEPEVKKGPREF
ncbi:MAG TPA: tetratricopeptide repeat protein [Pirellulales bacterium]|nr:tetratricopeptide repeat protein [Pirellulales bacterium]